jgi:hypothetical protein
MLIYRIVHATEPGADPFENGEMQHLKKRLEEYLRRQPERHEALTQQPRIVSEPEEASVDFDMIVVSADPARNVDEVKLRWKTQILFHEVPHYRMLANKLRNLPSANEFTDELKRALTLLLQYEIRYIRGCDIRWVGSSIAGDILQEQDRASGPC